MPWLDDDDWGNRAEAEKAEAAKAALVKRAREAEFVASVWKKNDERNKRLANNELRDLP